MTNNAILTLTSVVRKDSFVSLVTRMHACRLNSQYKSIWCKLLLDLLAFINSLAWENSRYLATLPTTALVSPPNDFWETSAEIPYWWRVTTQIWARAVLLKGRAAWKILLNQSEALPRSGKWRVISMEFLRSFRRRHLVGKPVVASPNVGCLLRLIIHKYDEMFAPL